MDSSHVRPLSEAAIRPRQDILASNQGRELDNSLSNKFGMLDDVGRMANHARNQHLVCWKFDSLPHTPFVFMANIRGFDRVATDTEPQKQVDDVFQRDI